MDFNIQKRKIVQLPPAKKASSIQYGYRECATHRRVLSSTKYVLKG